MRNPEIADAYMRGFEAGMERGTTLGYQQAASIFERQLVQLGDREYRPPSLQQVLAFTSDECPADRAGGNGNGHGRRRA